MTSNKTSKRFSWGICNGFHPWIGTDLSSPQKELCYRCWEKQVLPMLDDSITKDHHSWHLPSLLNTDVGKIGINTNLCIKTQNDWKVVWVDWEGSLGWCHQSNFPVSSWYISSKRMWFHTAWLDFRIHGLPPPSIYLFMFILFCLFIQSVLSLLYP